MPPLGHLSIPGPVAWHLEGTGHMLCECMETRFKAVAQKVCFSHRGLCCSFPELAWSWPDHTLWVAFLFQEMDVLLANHGETQASWGGALELGKEIPSGPNCSTVEGQEFPLVRVELWLPSSSSQPRPGPPSRSREWGRGHRQELSGALRSGRGCVNSEFWIWVVSEL